MFEFMVFEHEKQNGCKGYGWCGKQRWGTAIKRQLLNGYYQSLERFVIEYVGIAADEAQRIDIKPHKNYAKSYPLIKWGMTEADCLAFCYERGFFWEENGVRLYDVLDRVSCWCCKNKNRKELKAIYQFLPQYWEKLKELQAQIPMPMKPFSRKGIPYGNVFDLEKVFEQEVREERSAVPPKKKRRCCEQSR